MKKQIFKLLCNEYAGKVVAALFGDYIPNLRHGFRRYRTPAAYCNNTVKAMIFWGFYESAELRLIPKYIVADLPVVELGASLGIVSSRAINCLNKHSSYTCIEANPFLIEYITKNIQKFNAQANPVLVENLAIAYTNADTVEMQITQNNTQGRIAYGSNIAPGAVMVRTTTLKPYSDKPYTLICDIEGMEIEIFKNDEGSLVNCKHLFIELHKAYYETQVFEVDELKALIIQLGFRLVERDGNVFYFNKVLAG